MTYCLSLDETHVMVFRLDEVVLVEDVMFSCMDSANGCSEITSEDAYSLTKGSDMVVSDTRRHMAHLFRSSIRARRIESRSRAQRR